MGGSSETNGADQPAEASHDAPGEKPLPPSPPGHPVVGNTLDYARDLFGFVDESVEEVGDVVHVRMLGGDHYVLAHPDYFERALVTDRDVFVRSADFDIALGQSLNAVDGEAWRRQRPIFQEFFTQSRVRSYTDDMVEVIERRLETWADGDTISIHGQMKDVALEILFGALFDRPLEPGGDEELRWAANSLNEWFKPSSFVLPDWVPTPARRRFRKGQTRLRDEAERILAEREREFEAEEGGADGDPETTDLLSALVRMGRTGSADLTEREIRDQVLGFTFAGHDTTGLTLSFAWHLLASHPDVREQFYAELEEVLGVDPPTSEDVDDLELTRRIVYETQRRHTPVHTIPRTTTREVELGGYRLPEGSDVHLSVYRVHQDERFWEEPLTFRPSRWENTSPREEGYKYVPFGAGAHSCIGKRFARLEIVLALATIGQRYEIEPLSELEFAPEMTSQPADDLPGKIHAR